MSIWLVKTSPLVFLGNLGRLDLLRHHEREVYILRAVAEENSEKPDAAAQAVQAAREISLPVWNATDQTAVTLVQAALHKGEAEAIVLATELHAERVVMDDQDARRFANRCSLVIGTLRILLAAKQRGAIVSLRAEINALAFWDFVPIHDLSLPCYKVQGSKAL
jgi:predicted nucleic acid-binding protein